MRNKFLCKLQVDPFVAIYKNRLFDIGTNLAQVEKEYSFQEGQLQFFVNEKLIPFSEYKNIKPKAEDDVYARILEGMNAISGAVVSAFKWLFTTGAGAVQIGSAVQGAVAPTMAGAGWFGTGLVPNWLGWQVINFGAMYLLNDLFNDNNNNNRQETETPTLTVRNNSINRWGVVPVVLGATLHDTALCCSTLH